MVCGCVGGDSRSLKRDVGRVEAMRRGGGRGSKKEGGEVRERVERRGRQEGGSGVEGLVPEGEIIGVTER